MAAPTIRVAGEPDEAAMPLVADWEDAFPKAAPPSGRAAGRVTAGLALLFALAWTGFCVWANQRLWPSAAPAAWIQAVGQWSGPVLLIALAWLGLRPRGDKVAARFLATTQELEAATAALEARLTTANGELSVAREFLAAQTRDLDATGRLAVERIGQQAGVLQGLVRVGREDIEAIATVGATARENMELLRGHLPVIASSAKDVANNIGNGGRIAQAQLHELINGLQRLNEFGQACERQVASVSGGVDAALVSLAARADDINNAMATRDADTHAQALARHEGLSAALAATDARLHAYTAAAAEAEAAVAVASERAMAGLTAAATEHQRQIEQVSAATIRALAEVAGLGEGIRTTVADAEAGEALISENTARLAATLSEAQAGAASAMAKLAGLTDASVRLLELIQAAVDHSQHHLPAAIDKGTAALASVELRAAALHNTVQDAAAISSGLAAQIATTQADAAGAHTTLGEMHDALAARGEAQAQALAGLQAAINATAADAEALTARSEDALAPAIAALTAAAREAALALEHDSAAGIQRVADDLAAASRAAVDQAIATHTVDIAANLEAASALASQAGRESVLQLRGQLGKIDELVGNLEQRVSRAREMAEESIDNDFGRRMAVITEALNSSAVDIARALDAEVEDTAWAGYLRGDRGIFTRRAVRLLSATEAREISQIYETDPGFARNVNRYIHDFEAMLRQLLSTRDGHAMSVAMLSSDAGKLYVALAQAIDRLRD